MLARNIGIVFFALAGALSVTSARADDLHTCIYDNGAPALAACTRAIESGTYSGLDLGNAYINRGAEWLRIHENDKAIADENQAIKLIPRSTLAYTNRAHAFVEKGELDRAIADATAAIGFDQENPSAYNVRAEIYEKKGDIKRAIADYKRAIATKPVVDKIINVEKKIQYARDQLKRLQQK